MVLNACKAMPQTIILNIFDIIIMTLIKPKRPVVTGWAPDMFKFVVQALVRWW